MKNYFLSTILLLLFSQCQAQKNSNLINESNKIDRPKLVVGIVVDQMRYDYLVRFYEKYSDNGFKRLMNNGYNCENVHLNYTPTHTAVGHTSIYTGTTPNIHGIIGNNWYDKNSKEMIYCIDDENYQTVGTEKGGKKSPFRLKTTTIGDQLHLAQNNKGKIISISIKDRAAVLSGGHTANAAYWFRGKSEAKFISSSFYMQQLPSWVTNFNNLKKPQSYLSKTWDTLYDINSYTESIMDDNQFEKPFSDKITATFPYNLPKLLKNNSYDLIKKTPFGNSLLVDFAKAAIKGEDLGTHKNTDFLSISFSSTDYIGHQFGVDSKEVQDTYLRLDKDIALFIDFLDKQVGSNNYTLFLTADHGALSSYSYLKSLKIPSKFFDGNAFKQFVNDVVVTKFNSTEIVENISNFQIYLNHKKINELKLDVNEVSQFLVDNIITFEGVYKTITARTLQTVSFNKGILKYIQNGYNQKISGDVIIVPDPATVVYHELGSEHYSSYNYDTHIPLLFYGKGIKKGTSKRFIPVIDIAPTITSLLKIEFPNGNTGNVIEEVLE
jgi:predicted AlkP superfamily pyrophosphatase or phosphodiesterase